NADRVPVVLAVPHDGEAMDAGEVEALVPVALAGGPVAEPAPDHRVLTSVFHRVGDPGRMGDLRGDRGGPGDDPERGGAPVGRHLATARGRVVLLAEHREEDDPGPHPGDEADAHVAVVGDEDVRAAAEWPRGADLTTLVP